MSGRCTECLGGTLVDALSAWEQPLMVRTFLKVYMELSSYFLFLQEQIKDIIIIIVKV